MSSNMKVIESELVPVFYCNTGCGVDLLPLLMPIIKPLNLAVKFQKTFGKQFSHAKLKVQTAIGNLLT